MSTDNSYYPLTDHTEIAKEKYLVTFMLRKMRKIRLIKAVYILNFSAVIKNDFCDKVLYEVDTDVYRKFGKYTCIP